MLLPLFVANADAAALYIEKLGYVCLDEDGWLSRRTGTHRGDIYGIKMEEVITMRMCVVFHIMVVGFWRGVRVNFCSQTLESVFKCRWRLHKLFYY